MTYSSMANFQGEGSLDITPKKDKSYQNYSYAPPEEELLGYEVAPESEFNIVTPKESKNYESTINFEATEENLKRVMKSSTIGYKGYGTSPEGEFGGAGLGAKPPTTEPVIKEEEPLGYEVADIDDDKPTSYLDSVKANLINAAFGSVEKVKEFLGVDTSEPDNDYNLVYDEYDTLYMPQELKVKNVPMGPKNVLTNYVPYVNTYSLTGTDPVIPQESLIDPRGEFPYTDDYRERIQNILDDDAIKRTSAELGISVQRALEMYLNSEVPPAVQEYIDLNLGAALRPPEPAFKRYEVADATGSFDSLVGLEGWIKSSDLSSEMFNYTPFEDGEVVLKKDIDVTEFNYDASRKATLTDLKNGIKGILDAGKFKMPESNIAPERSSTEEVGGLGSFLLDVDPKVRLGGVGIDVDTSLGNWSAYSDWDGGDASLNFTTKDDNISATITNDGTLSLEFKMDF